MYLIFGIGITTIYILNLRDTGREAGGKIWWNNQRPIFGLIWVSFGILAILGKKDIAWKVLAVDVLFGLALFLNHHFIQFYVK